MNKATKMLGSVAALGALALGASTFADAASKSTTSQSTTTQSTVAPTATAPPQGPAQGPPRGPNGRHVGANGKEEQALSSSVATKVADAALAKVKGTVIRTETDADHGSPYEAHIRKSDGSEVEVLVNESFEVTAVNPMPSHP